MKRRTSRLHGIGIDIVSRTRAKQFLARHRGMIMRRFLNSAERRQLKRIRPEQFAELFAAKEAFFKACGEKWMGLEGFQGMTVTKRRGDRFEIRWKPGCSNKTYKGEGVFFRDGDIVGAQTMVWS